MKYAKEVIELMGSFPGKEFRMNEIVRYVAKGSASKRERDAIRLQIRVVLNQLEESGCVTIIKSSGNTSPLRYVWGKTVSFGGLKTVCESVRIMPV